MNVAGLVLLIVGFISFMLLSMGMGSGIMLFGIGFNLFHTGKVLSTMLNRSA